MVGQDAYPPGAGPPPRVMRPRGDQIETACHAKQLGNRNYDLNDLDTIQYFHQNPSFQGQVTTDPFRTVINSMRQNPGGLPASVAAAGPQGGMVSAERRTQLRTIPRIRSREEEAPRQIQEAELFDPLEDERNTQEVSQSLMSLDLVSMTPSKFCAAMNLKEAQECPSFLMNDQASMQDMDDLRIQRLEEDEVFSDGLVAQNYLATLEGHNPVLIEHLHQEETEVFNQFAQEYDDCREHKGDEKDNGLDSTQSISQLGSRQSFHGFIPGEQPEEDDQLMQGRNSIKSIVDPLYYDYDRGAFGECYVEQQPPPSALIDEQSLLEDSKMIPVPGTSSQMRDSSTYTRDNFSDVDKRVEDDDPILRWEQRTPQATNLFDFCLNSLGHPQPSPVSSVRSQTMSGFEEVKLEDFDSLSNYPQPFGQGYGSIQQQSLANQEQSKVSPQSFAQAQPSVHPNSSIHAPQSMDQGYTRLSNFASQPYPGDSWRASSIYPPYSLQRQLNQAPNFRPREIDKISQASKHIFKNKAAAAMPLMAPLSKQASCASSNLKNKLAQPKRSAKFVIKIGDAVIRQSEVQDLTVESRSMDLPSATSHHLQKTDMKVGDPAVEDPKSETLTMAEILQRPRCPQSPQLAQHYQQVPTQVPEQVELQNSKQLDLKSSSSSLVRISELPDDVQMKEEVAPRAQRPKQPSPKATSKKSYPASKSEKKSKKAARQDMNFTQISEMNNILEEQKKAEQPRRTAEGKRITKVSIAQKKSEKYYKQFDYFFHRSCFRAMAEFYKEKFHSFYKEQMVQLKKRDFDMWQIKGKGGGLGTYTKDEIYVLIDDFLVSLFGKKMLSSKLSKEEHAQLSHSVMMVVFSHRFNKDDKFVLEIREGCESNPIDYTIVRDVLYKYSKKASDRFIALPAKSFLFATFALSDEGLKFLHAKPDNNDPEKLKRLYHDLAELKTSAINCLKRQAQLHDQGEVADPAETVKQSPRLGMHLMDCLKELTNNQF